MMTVHHDSVEVALVPGDMGLPQARPLTTRTGQSPLS